MRRRPFITQRRKLSARGTFDITRVLAAVIAGGALLQPAAAFEGVTDTTSAVNSLFGLRASAPFVLTSPPSTTATSSAYRFQVPIAGGLKTIELIPHSVRAPGFTVEVQRADGSYETIDPGPPSTLRGIVVGQPGSVVAGTVTAEGLRAMILLADHTKLWVEPIPARAASGTNDHIVFRHEDMNPTAAACTLARPVDTPTPLDNANTAFGVNTQLVSDGVTAGITMAIAELAADADFEYFANFGDATLVTNDIENIVNLTDIQYERDVHIRHVLTRVIVRTAEPNVYSRVCAGGSANSRPCHTNGDCPGGVCPAEVDPDSLLNTLMNHWNTTQSHVARDVTQLFTGKDMIGSVIGVAWRGTSATPTICGTQTTRNHGYSVVETNCAGCNLTARRTDLTAHELGHNWSADHCACPGWTMNPAITNANRFHETFSIPEITAFRDTLTCLDATNELIRLFLTTDKSAIGEAETLQLTAEADFVSGPNQDVTTNAIWAIEPPTAGSIDAAGVFTPTNVNGSLCVTVTGTYSSGGIVKSSQVSFTLYDDQQPLMIVSADPPLAAIDARQPTDPNGTNPAGWDALTITLNGAICLPSIFDFDVTATGGSQVVPQVLSIDQLDPTTYTLHLEYAIEPGTWTNVVHFDTGVTTRFGYLPGDVNGDGTAGPADILALIDSLNGVGPPRPIWSLDIDRSGVTGAPDILAVIDLLNGAGGFDPWNGVSLP